MGLTKKQLNTQAGETPKNNLKYETFRCSTFTPLIVFIDPLMFLNFPQEGFQKTLPETNSKFAPENRPNLPQKEAGSSSNHLLSGAFVSFREDNSYDSS